MKYIQSVNEFYKIFESERVDIFSCKETIEDLLLELNDEGIDTNVEVMDKHYTDTVSCESDIEDAKKNDETDEYIKELMNLKTSLIAIKLSQYSRVRKISYDDPVIKNAFERICGYCKSIGMKKVDPRKIAFYGEDENQFGQMEVCFTDGELPYGHKTISIDEFEKKNREL